MNDQTALGKIVQRAQFVTKLSEAAGVLAADGKKDLSASVASARDLIQGLPATPLTDVEARVRLQRDRNAVQWGGIEHDMEHEPIEWLEYIQKQVRMGHMEEKLGDYRQRLINIAALAEDALEAIERKRL